MLQSNCRPPKRATRKPNATNRRLPRAKNATAVLGVDHTTVPGFAAPTVLLLLSELRPDFAEKFPTAKHFGSWLGLCPDNRITGGKIYSVRTRAVKSCVAEALRLAAQTL